MSQDRSKAVSFTNFALKILQKILSVKITTSGEENIPQDCPTLFLANHFTRMETFIVPFVINKNKNLPFCRSLAHRDLFIGKLGAYLKQVGTVSTGDNRRDEIILEDLRTGDANWLIYPEGMMVKDKKIFVNSSFGNIKVSAKTGSSVLAIKAANLARRMKSDGVKSHLICPVSISYINLAPKDNNKLKKLLLRLFKKLPERLLEELSVEGAILENSTIDIHFGKPISVSDFIANTARIADKIPLLSSEKKDDLIIKTNRFLLTCEVMKSIYHNVCLTFEHFFSVVLISLAKVGLSKISILEFKERIFCIIAFAFLDGRKIRLHDTIQYWNVTRILTDNVFAKFDEMLHLARSLDLIYFDGGFVNIKINSVLQDWGFDKVRVKNIFAVFYNEISYFEKTVKFGDSIAKFGGKQISVLTSEMIEKWSDGVFYREYDKFYDPNFSKQKNLGCPKLYIPKKFFSGMQKTCIVISHGYKSSPAEVADFGAFCAKNGVSVYALRLRGHGTSPIDMKNTTHEDWQHSYEIGYQMAKRRFKNVVLAGFSTGGLLALNSSISKTRSDVCCVISISAALRLCDIRFKLVRFVKMWSDVLQKFDGDAKDFVESEPENPQINYARNYFCCMVELQKLMNKTHDILQKVEHPILVVQSTQDPVVNPDSAKEIFQKTGSKLKEIFEVNIPKHVIVYGPETFRVFQKILKFIKMY